MPRFSLPVLLTRPITFFYTLATLILWGFAWVHAFGMDMTHDEAYSYRLIKTNYFRALFGSANTHWLNSFFMEIEQWVLGDAPGWLRLHSVLAFPFFSLAIYRLGQLINALPAQLLFYALVLFNPYLMDFFSLARGYGLAMTFQAWSLVYFIRAAREGYQYRYWLLVWVMNVLMIASNLSYFYTVSGMAGFFLFSVVSQKLRGRPLEKGAIRLVLLYQLLLLGTIADLLFIKHYGKDLGFGGNTNLVGSLFGSVWEGTLYGATYQGWGPVLTQVSYYLILFLCLLYSWKAARHKTIPTGFLLSIPLLSMLVLNTVYHVFFNTPFLYQRTALQWYVSGVLLIGVAGGNWLSGFPRFRMPGISLAVVLCFLSGIHFYTRIDHQWCYEWSLQSNSHRALLDLYAQSPRRPSIGFATGGVYQNYYRLLSDSLWPVPKDLPDQYAHRSDTALRRRLLESDYVLTSYPVTIDCLRDLGLRYTVLKTYAPGDHRLIRIGQ